VAQSRRQTIYALEPSQLDAYLLFELVAPSIPKAFA
jgi:hypothetical protein